MCYITLMCYSTLMWHQCAARLAAENQDDNQSSTPAKLQSLELRKMASLKAIRRIWYGQQNIIEYILHRRVQYWTVVVVVVNNLCHMWYRDIVCNIWYCVIVILWYRVQYVILWYCDMRCFCRALSPFHLLHPALPNIFTSDLISSGQSKEEYLPYYVKHISHMLRKKIPKLFWEHVCINPPRS